MQHRTAAQPPALPPPPRVPANPESAWATDPALRAEFGEDKSRFLAFCRGMSSGRAKIQPRRTMRFVQEARSGF